MFNGWSRTTGEADDTPRAPHRTTLPVQPRNHYNKTMHSINRSVAIIRPKQPFVDWANQLRDATYEVTLDDLREDCLAVLIPEYETAEQAKNARRKDVARDPRERALGMVP